MSKSVLLWFTILVTTLPTQSYIVDNISAIKTFLLNHEIFFISLPSYPKFSRKVSWNLSGNQFNISWSWSCETALLINMLFRFINLCHSTALTFLIITEAAEILNNINYVSRLWPSFLPPFTSTPQALLQWIFIDIREMFSCLLNFLSSTYKEKLKLNQKTFLRRLWVVIKALFENNLNEIWKLTSCINLAQQNETT